MANKGVFSSARRGKTTPPTTTTNKAGGRAYEFGPKHALAQFAATGTFNDSYYSSALDQVEVVLDLCTKNDPFFIAQTAVYAREKGSMKDMPALLCAHLTTRGEEGLRLLTAIFPMVINNGKMLRNFVQIMRSGKVGRKSLGTRPKKLVQSWFESRPSSTIFQQSIGKDPSFGDVIKLSRPKPENDERRALYAYLAGRPYEHSHLPELVRYYEEFKATKANAPGVEMELPKVPWQMLEGLSLSDKDWKNLAKQASWTQTRMNINTFARHGVFKDAKMVDLIANRLRDPELIRKAKPFPYQLLAAYLNTTRARSSLGWGIYDYDKQTADVPRDVQNALQDALELSTEFVPIVDGPIYVCPDVSGSMSHPVTGIRRGATTKVRCIDVAALVASIFLRRNQQAEVLPFEHNVSRVSLNPRDTIMTNAEKLARIGGGGTNCAAPMGRLNKRKAKGKLVVYISDNESWVDTSMPHGRSYFGYRQGTGLLNEWNEFKARNPEAKLVCIDITPHGTAQALDRDDIMNIGGFSDSIFDTIAKFVEGGSAALTAEHWVSIIEDVAIPS